MTVKEAPIEIIINALKPLAKQVEDGGIQDFQLFTSRILGWPDPKRPENQDTKETQPEE